MPTTEISTLQPVVTDPQFWQLSADKKVLKERQQFAIEVR